MRCYEMWIRQKYDLPSKNLNESKQYLNNLLARNSTIIKGAELKYATPSPMPEPGVLFIVHVKVDFNGGQFVPFIDSITNDPYFFREKMPKLNCA